MGCAGFSFVCVESFLGSWYQSSCKFKAFLRFLDDCTKDQRIVYLFRLTEFLIFYLQILTIFLQRKGGLWYCLLAREYVFQSECCVCCCVCCCVFCCILSILFAARKCGFKPAIYVFAGVL